MIHDAAAAIEALEKALIEENEAEDDMYRLVCEKQSKIEELQAENKELRGRVEDEELKIDFLTADNTNYEIAIEELKAQFPKRGEWIKHQEVKNIYGGVCIECPFCGEKYVVQYIADEKFCRNCGADMRKMEVQE